MIEVDKQGTWIKIKELGEISQRAGAWDLHVHVPKSNSWYYMSHPRTPGHKKHHTVEPEYRIFWSNEASITRFGFQLLLHTTRKAAFQQKEVLGGPSTCMIDSEKGHTLLTFWKNVILFQIVPWYTSYLLKLKTREKWALKNSSTLKKLPHKMLIIQNMLDKLLSCSLESRMCMYLMTNIKQLAMGAVN